MFVWVIKIFDKEENEWSLRGAFTSFEKAFKSLEGDGFIPFTSSADWDAYFPDMNLFADIEETYYWSE